MYKTMNQVHAPTLQPTHWACINSVIASLRAVCVPMEMICMHTYTDKGV